MDTAAHRAITRWGVGFVAVPGRIIFADQRFLELGKVLCQWSSNFMGVAIVVRVDYATNPERYFGFQLRRDTQGRCLVGRAAAPALAFAVVVEPLKIIRAAAIPFSAAFEYRCHSSLSFLILNEPQPQHRPDLVE